MTYSSLVNNKTILLVLLLVLFVVLRLPGLSLPYHQDEFKYVSASESMKAINGFGHPPLLQIWFLAGHFVLGPDQLRLWPFLFSLAACVLLFLTIRQRVGERAALWTIFIFTFSFYSIWSSLMVDVDGSLLAFCAILSFYLYDYWRLSKSNGKNLSLIWLGLALLLGFLVKLSFILVFGAILLDFLWESRAVFSIRKISVFLLALASFGSVLIACFLAFDAFFSPFSLRAMFAHAQYYAEGGRNLTQILVQTLKALFYLSPLVIAPLFLIKQTTVTKLRPLFIYIGLGLLFYLVLFDFSRGALDKYLMFSVIPLSAIAGVALDEVFATNKAKNNKILIPSLIIAIGLLALNFLTHIAVPLYPKNEWFSRVTHFRWNILTPFTGGSGPVGFYVSFLFIASAFLLCFLVVFIGLLKKDWRRGAAILIIMIGLTYNVVFAEEFAFGAINGSISQALYPAIDFLNNHKEIKSVITYNDIGAYELSRIGKYAGRFYATPQFVEGHKKLFAEHDKRGGYYLVTEMPLLFDGFYKVFFFHCQTMFETSSQVITSRIYSCSNKKS